MTDIPDTERCPNCGVKLFISGKGTMVDARAQTYGTPNPKGGCDGAKSLYRCRVCDHTWVVTFPDNSIFLAARGEETKHDA